MPSCSKSSGWARSGRGRPWKSGRRETAKEIRARSMLRAHLAEIGAKDERFLGPEWILAANDAVSSMRRDASAESVLEEFRRRTEESS